MDTKIRKVEYYYAECPDKTGLTYGLLEMLNKKGINLLAFHVFPLSSKEAQIDFFPEEPKKMRAAMAETGIHLLGPCYAFLIQGVDSSGAVLNEHRKLAEADINVIASTGVVDGEGHFGYLLWVAAGDIDRATKLLGV
jgi:hypothetical protein